MTRGPVRLAGALVLLSGAVMLTACSGDAGDPAPVLPACYAPLACGPSYPVPVYPWAASPYLGYLHDPAHVIIMTAGPRTTVIYRPYSPPLRPAFAPPPPRQAPPAPAARPAAPKPPAARPAAPAPRPASRK